MPEEYPHTYEAAERGGPEFDITKGREVWRQAKTLREYGMATAMWLEGQIGHMPTAGFYSHPNEETMALLPYINPLNRQGLL